MKLTITAELNADEGTVELATRDRYQKVIAQIKGDDIMIAEREALSIDDELLVRVALRRLVRGK